MIIRNGVFGLVLATVALFGAMPLALVAQEPGGEEPAPSREQAPAATKKAVDPSRRVPPFFGQVGLTAEQKDAIYQVRSKHQARLDALKKEMAEVQAAMLNECEALLSDSQKQLLALRRDAATRARKDRDTIAVTPKSALKPAN